LRTIVVNRHVANLTGNAIHASIELAANYDA
jgi:hypothetical protein